MTLSRKSSRIFCDTYDLSGAINALYRLEEEQNEKADTEATASAFMKLGAYHGAWLALELLMATDHIDTQREFITLFEARLEEMEE